MFIYPAISGVVLCAMLIPGLSRAQSNPPARQSGRPSNTRTSAAKKARNRILAQQRLTAISLLTLLADEAQGFKDQGGRTRIQAQVADALWESDQDRARILFKQAWETAEKTDKEGEERVREERRKRLTTDTGKLIIIAPPPNLRAEVLKLAARRDSRLGEEFLARLNEEAAQQEETDKPEQRQKEAYPDPSDPAPSVIKRLDLAKQLMADGDIERATQFAAAALNNVTLQGVNFLSALRQQNPLVADRLYSALLAKVVFDPSSDATTVSLLSSYVFAPFFYVTVTSAGTMSGRWQEPASGTLPSPQLRAAFLNAAAQILLRPVLPNLRLTLAGPGGTYFTIARLLPFFERYAPDRVPALRAQLATLTPDAPVSFRDGSDSLLTVGLSPRSPENEVQVQLDRLDPALSSTELDKIYAGAVHAAITSGDPRARSLVDKIEDDDLRNRARAFVDFVGVRNALVKKDVEEALRLARIGELSHIQRVWAFTEIARLLKQSDLARSIELLSEATYEARQLGRAEPEHAEAFISIATLFFELDRTKTWEMMMEVADAVNSAANFTGGRGKISVQLQTETMVAMMDYPAPGFDLKGLMSLLAKDDFNRAVELAKGLKDEMPRASAIIAIARSVLEKKKTGKAG